MSSTQIDLRAAKRRLWKSPLQSNGLIPEKTESAWFLLTTVQVNVKVHLLNLVADTKKSANIVTRKAFDINLIYSRVICLQVSNRDIDHLVSLELAPLPAALFADSTSKSNLKIEVSSRVHVVNK